MATCNVCCEEYNSRDGRSVTICSREECKFTCCKQCLSTYILQGETDAHCMNCKFKYDEKTLITFFKPSFLNKEYKNKRAEIFFELEKSLIPSTQADARKKILCEEEDKKINKCNEFIREYREKIKKIQEEIIQLKLNKERIMNNTDKCEKYEFKCLKTYCNGYINANYNCTICDILYCEMCLAEKEKEHQCKEEDLKTTKLIREETKPCPRCVTRIYKIDGCDQMWCTECKTAFSWETSNIETKNIHNPHYHDYIRNNGIMPRAIGDVRCGGIPNLFNEWQILEKKILESYNLIEIVPFNEILQKNRTISMIIRSYENLTRRLHNNEIYKGLEHPEKLKENRILYILGRIDENIWKKRTYKIKSVMEKDAQHREIMNLLFNVGLDILIDLRHKLKKFKNKVIISHEEYKSIFKKVNKMKKDYDGIIKYTQDITLARIKTFKTPHYLIKCISNHHHIEWRIKSYSSVRAYTLEPWKHDKMDLKDL